MPLSVLEQIAELRAAVADLQGRVTTLEAPLPALLEVATRLPWASPDTTPPTPNYI